MFFLIQKAELCKGKHRKVHLSYFPHPPHSGAPFQFIFNCLVFIFPIQENQDI